MLSLVLTAGNPTGAKEQVTISLLSQTASADCVAVQIAEFEKLHPHIRVESLFMTGGWQDKLVTEMLAGTAPDAFEFWSPFNQQLRQRGLLLNLTPYMQRDFTAEDIADFFPTVWETSFTRIGPQAGSQFIMPRYINVMVFHYSIDRFRAAGLSEPLDLDARGEWNWQTLRDSARKLTIRDGAQVTHYGAVISISSLPRVLNWIWGAGGDLIDPNDPSKFVGDTPEAEAGVQFICDMIWQDGSASPTFSSGLFINGTVGILEDGMGVVPTLRKRIGDNFRWNSVRRAEGPAGRPGYLVDDSYGIWAESPHPDETWELVKFLVSREGQEIMVKYSGYPPVRRSAVRAYLNLAPDHNLRAFADAVADSRPTIFSRMQGDIATLYSTLWAMLTSVLNNSQPYRVAVEAYRSQIEALLAEAR